MTEATVNARIQGVRKARVRGDVDYLVRALTDPDVRAWAARYLGKLGATESIPELLRLLRSNDARARMAGADALADLEVREAVPELIALAERDPDPRVRGHATWALGEIGDLRGEPVLIELLNDNWVIAETAAHALGKFGSESAIPAIEATAARRRFFMRRVYRRAVRKIRRRTRSI